VAGDSQKPTKRDRRREKEAGAMAISPTVVFHEDAMGKISGRSGTGRGGGGLRVNGESPVYRNFDVARNGVNLLG